MNKKTDTKIDLNSVIERYNSIECINNIEKEFELKMIHTSDEKCKILFKYFMDLITVGTDATNTQTINFIQSSAKKNIIKELHFDNGVQNKEKKRIYTKERIEKTVYLTSEFKADLSLEENLTSTTMEDFNFIRFKNRFSFQISDWRIDFTFVIESNKKDTAEMQKTRDKLFKGINIENIFDNIYIWKDAKIEIEFEFTGDILSVKCIDNLMLIMSRMDNNPQQESILKKVYRLINDKSLNKEATLKSILPNAIEMNKRQYFEEVFPSIKDFFITDKIDGQRVILIINEDDISLYTTEHIFVCKNTYFTDVTESETILECEMVGDEFYMYDIIQSGSINVSKLPFEQRLDYMANIIELCTWDRLKLKEFVRLTDMHSDQLRDFLKSDKSAEKTKEKTKGYKTDGIIFTSADSSYKTTKYYKWKPMSHMTIDFIAKKCPNKLLGIHPYISKDDADLYMLFSGISKKEFQTFNMVKIKHYDSLFARMEDYFPIQFSPSDNPMAYLYWHPKDSGVDIDDKVVELQYSNEWKLLKVRDDRSDDYSKKKYFGNHFKVAELIWRNYSNPLTSDLICAKEIPKEFYFKVHNSNAHTHVRKFNNFVKSQLIEHLSRWDSKVESYVIDLGSGKGQDIFKYASNRIIKNAIFVDNNENNLCSIIERKYKLIDPNAYKALGVFIQKLDLNDNWKTNCEKIKSVSTKLVICNFAIHYFVKNVESITNFVNFIDSILPVGARFMFTCLNGENVHALLNNNNWGDGKKYFINLVNKSKSDKPVKKFLGGEEIEILLPFSDGDLYKEYLVNLKLMETMLKKKKIAIESQGNFGDAYLDKFKEQHPDNFNSLEADDLEYIKLVWFSIYYKKK